MTTATLRISPRGSHLWTIRHAGRVSRRRLSARTAALIRAIAREFDPALRRLARS